MKNFIYLIIIVVFANCKGEQGDIGPQGDTGAKGATGTAGQVGPAGVTGDKGAAGAVGSPGVIGDKGATPAINVLFSDWDNITTWKVSGTNKFNYSALKSYNLTMLPNSENLLLSYISSAGSYLVRDTKTKEPVGSFYVYYSITNPAKEETIFSETYNYGSFQVVNNSTTFFNVVNFKTVPSLENDLAINFSSNSFKDTDDFLGLITEMKPKVRFIYIPIGMPVKTGRKITNFSTYKELADAYDIPLNGASR